jgi:hypothetical protein
LKKTLWDNNVKKFHAGARIEAFSLQFVVSLSGLSSLTILSGK